MSAAFRLTHLRRMAAAQSLQLVHQRGIVRVDAGGLLCFVEQDNGFLFRFGQLHRSAPFA